MAEQQVAEQPATESADLDALLEAKFGENEVAEPQQPEGEQEAAAEEATGEEVSTEPEFAEVEFNGNKYQVPPELKDALMAQSDYTAKTTEIANTRRALELQQKELAIFKEARAFEAEISAEVDWVRTADAWLKIEDEALGREWPSLTTDQRQERQFQIHRTEKERNRLAKVIEDKRAEFTNKISADQAKLKQSATEVLTKAIPSWNDETRAAVEKYAQSMGYPETVLPNMSALDYQVLWKAQQYDKVKAEAKGAVKKASEAPVIAPTARKNPMPQRVRTKLDLKNAVKSGNKASIEAAADRRLEQLFGG
jgi:hypothetical protein